MDPIVQAIISVITLLGGLCGFIYWVFSVMEKRLEIKFDLLSNHMENKIDNLSESVHKIADEMKHERFRTDALYKFVLDNYRQDKKV